MCVLCGAGVGAAALHSASQPASLHRIIAMVRTPAPPRSLTLPPRFQNKAFVFDRTTVGLSLEAATGCGTVTYEGVWAGDGQRYHVTMVTPPLAAGRGASGLPTTSSVEQLQVRGEGGGGAGGACRCRCRAAAATLLLPLPLPRLGCGGRRPAAGGGRPLTERCFRQGPPPHVPLSRTRSRGKIMGCTPPRLSAYEQIVHVLCAAPAALRLPVWCSDPRLAPPSPGPGHTALLWRLLPAAGCTALLCRSACTWCHRRCRAAAWPAQTAGTSGRPRRQGPGQWLEGRLPAAWARAWPCLADRWLWPRGCAASSAASA